MKARRNNRAQPGSAVPDCTDSRPVPVLYAALLVGATALIYANSLAGPFTFDDASSIVDNTHIQHLWPLYDALSTPSQGEPVAGRPLINLSFAVNFAISGLRVAGYHVVNVGIHIFCALLLFGLVRRLLLAPRLVGRFSDRAATLLAFVCALLWTVHPLQTEAVDYISARTESLMSLFYLLTLYAAVRAAASQHSLRWMAGCVGACALGMACKETMATAPLMVALIDRTFLYGSFAKALQARKRLYAGLAASWLVLAGLEWRAPRAESAGFFTSVTPWTYLLNQAIVITRYLRLAVWPKPLVLDYGIPQPLALARAAPAAAFILVLLAVTAAALWLRPLWGFLGAWFFIILAPTSSVIPIASEVGAESRMYLPLAAIIALAVVSTYLASNRIARIAGGIAVVLICAALAGATIRRNAEYQSGVRLWQTVVQRWPHARAHRNLALELKAAGFRDEVIAEWREVVKEEPDSRYELGRELFDQKRPDEAAVELNRFVREYLSDHYALPARNLIALVVSAQGKQAEAIEQWGEIVKAKPEDSDAQESLADALLAEGRFADARSHYLEVLKIRPGDEAAWANLGVALAATRTAGSAEAFTRAVALDPGDARAQFGLAAALLEQQDIAGAIQHANAALRIAPDASPAHTILGVALLAQSKVDDAIEQFQAALRLDPDDADARDALIKARAIKRAH